jgi:competence protein ComEA
MNLASLIADGQRIDVPAQRAGAAPGEAPSGVSPTVEIPSRSPGSAALPESEIGSSPALVDINTALQAELEILPGIGPALAGRIIAYREENGPFKTIEEIQKVQGIGAKIFEKIKDLITITP